MMHDQLDPGDYPKLSKWKYFKQKNIYLLVLKFFLSQGFSHIFYLNYQVVKDCKFLFRVKLDVRGPVSTAPLN